MRAGKNTALCFKTMSHAYLARNPLVLVIVGLIASGYGLHLILRGIQGDTLVPGTSFTYLPDGCSSVQESFCNFPSWERYGF